MPNNLPARIPVRANTDVTPSSTSETAPSGPTEIRALIPPPNPQPLSAPPGFLLDRRSLTRALRFLARLASGAPVAALNGVLFGEGFVVATDLDVVLRVWIPGVRDLGVLAPADALKRFLSGSTERDVEIARVAPTEARPFAVSVDGAILVGHDARDFPDPSALFPRSGIRARAQFQTLAPLLVAAAVEESRKAMNAVFFQLCKNTAVATESAPRRSIGFSRRGSPGYRRRGSGSRSTAASESRSENRPARSFPPVSASSSSSPTSRYSRCRRGMRSASLATSRSKPPRRS
jgi:hypothetical protein